MGLLKRRTSSSSMPDPAALADPERALRIAAEALAGTSTYVDELGRRREMPVAMRQQLAASLNSAASTRCADAGGPLATDDAR